MQLIKFLVQVKDQLIPLDNIIKKEKNYFQQLELWS
jgi:hypothetical protein